MSTVKISALELENIKRIKAVQLTLTPNGLNIIGGNNRQGKTSVLDAGMTLAVRQAYREVRANEAENG